MRSQPVEVHRITTAEPPQSREQAARQRTYLLMMGTRMIAIVVAVVVPGIWRWIAIVVGITFPYLAVVLANAVHERDEDEAPRPFVPDHKPVLDDRPAEERIYRPEPPED